MLAVWGGETPNEISPYLALTKKNNAFSTAIFFSKQTSDNLLEAISIFETQTFDRNKISKYAEKFSEEKFRKKIRKFINNN